MKNLGVWLLSVVWLCGVGCSSSDDCKLQDHWVCTSGVLYWADSCGNIESLIMMCQKGCRVDGSACQEQPYPCKTAADCPAGQGCTATKICGECTLDTECRSGERCSGGLCVAKCTGPCCDDQGSFKPAGTVCKTWSETRCSSTGCGGDPQTRTNTQACSGVSAACDGPVTEGRWNTIVNCGMNQLCKLEGDTGSCTTCDVACREGACIGCSNEPCCKGGQLADKTTVCNTTTEYRCSATTCGADIISRTVKQYCDGINLECRGKIEYTSWSTYRECADNALCLVQGQQASCQECLNGCQSGACREPCQDGPCCQNGQLLGADTVCSQEKEYRCYGDVCGGEAQTRQINQNCSGTASTCSGSVTVSEWQTVEACGQDDVCQIDQQGAAVCLTCELGCSEKGCNPCTNEPCCDMGAYRPSNFQCNTWTEYRCFGTGCGADPQQRAVRQYCSGNSYLCTGAVVPDAWLNIENCNNSQICQTDGQSYAECQTCANGCSDGQCNP